MEKFNQIIEFALSIHFIASAICALTPTQKDDNLLGKLYKLIEICALVVGKAKNK